MLDSSPNREGFAYFYCNRHEEDRRQSLSILRSYVRQLSAPRTSPGHIQKSLRDLCQEARLKGSNLSSDVCDDQLLESVNAYTSTTIILDALDECDDRSRTRILTTIDNLLSKSMRPVRVLISSRPDNDIYANLSSQPSIEVQDAENKGDIEKFIRCEISKPRRYGTISPPLRESIVRTLLERSQGM
jgi:ankyrin repeat domain-containing protein 50